MLFAQFFTKRITERMFIEFGICGTETEAAVTCKAQDSVRLDKVASALCSDRSSRLSYFKVFRM